MILHPRKGAARVALDRERRAAGEPPSNRERNETPHCHYPAGSKATRKRGRNRFKTGRKQKNQ